MRSFGSLVFVALFVAAGWGAGATAQESVALTAQESAPDPKCGFPYRLGSLLGVAVPGYPPSAKDADLMPAPSGGGQLSRVIGRFEFFYDTTGMYDPLLRISPALLAGDSVRIPGSAEAFVDSAGRLFNEAYDFMLDSLGYANPMYPGWDLYRVDIVGSAFYGQTYPGLRIGSTTPARYESSISIDNDFLNFYTPGMGGLKVTAAHELFHAVQLGSYGVWNDDIYFLELSSTWMEDAAYPDIDDYYQYVRIETPMGTYLPRGHFASPDRSFTSTDGLIEYSRATFGKYLEKRHSRDMMKMVWEQIPAGPALGAIDRALASVGTSFTEAFLAWSLWNSKTGILADTATYYEEGRQFPPVRRRPAMPFSPPTTTITDSLAPLSSLYYPITLDESSGLTMETIVSNFKTGTGPSRLNFSYTVATSGDESYKRLSNGYLVKLTVPDPGFWATQESVPPVLTSIAVSPNPYLATGSARLRFTVPASSAPVSMKLRVLASSLMRVYEGDLVYRSDLSTPYAQVGEWQGMDDDGNPLGSGVYFFFLTVDGQEYSGKFAAIR